MYLIDSGGLNYMKKFASMMFTLILIFSSFSIQSFAGIFTPTSDYEWATFVNNNNDSVVSMIKEHDGESLSYYFCAGLREQYPDLEQRITNLLDNIEEDIVSIYRSPWPTVDGYANWHYKINTTESYQTYIFTLDVLWGSSYSEEKRGIYFCALEKCMPSWYQGDTYSKYDKPYCDLAYYHYDIIALPGHVTANYREEIGIPHFNPSKLSNAVREVNTSLGENNGRVSVYYKSSDNNVVRLTEENKLIAVGQGTCTFDTIWVNPDGTEAMYRSVEYTVEYTWWQKLIRILLLGFLWY